MKVSVIIPVYNVEKYLRQCIDSVIQQNYKNLEIILVDDGSTDKSCNICDEYEAQDDRIKVMHKSNGGLMSAWKAGFLASTGKYIGFVDSDDWIDQNMYEQLIKNAISHEADIVVCQLIREIDGKAAVREKLRLQPGLYNLDKIRNDIIPGIINDGTYLGRKLSPSRVTKLFKREIIKNNLQFCDESISLGEDLVTCFSSVCDAKKVVVLSDFFPYHYRINNQSITGRYDPNRIYEVEKLNGKLKQIAMHKGINIVDQIANDYISLALLCIESEILYAPYSMKEILKRIKEIYKSELFTQSLENGNIKRFPTKHKIYLYLLKRNRYEALYFFRKIISQVKNR